MVLMAHFIDDDWNLHKRILNFCQVANHKGDTIGRAIEKCLEGWGIDRLFTVTVDNASSNDVAIAYLVKKFKGRNGLVLDGEFIHIRCCAHILNLIVSDALKDLHVSIIRIRNAVKYVRSSPARLQIFKDFAKEDKMSTKNCLTMDVPTRWNSTFTMLDGAIKCQKTFERLEEHDPSYLPKDDIPTTEDWDNAKVFVKFLKTFSETKFNKYWGITTSEKTNLLLYVSVVLDPRFKQSNKTCQDDAKTEVTRYLDEARIDCMGDEYLDLLTWWKVNSSLFMIISQVARDIYSIPISAVPSESVFSTGGRVLDSFRSSLTPQTAEALICAQNWIQSKPLDDMTEEIDGAEEIDEEFINIGKEMESAFENLNNDSMELKYVLHTVPESVEMIGTAATIRLLLLDDEDEEEDLKSALRLAFTQLMSAPKLLISKVISELTRRLHSESENVGSKETDYMDDEAMFPSATSVGEIVPFQKPDSSLVLF
ncbi:putative transposase [Cucumis melo var. makuwa]|uniref:Putative transposase n=1 Tax=Cucumis melo var. makuwa TaxID=1194695 RepID=A0A5D3CE46_CUCMM|nr:putative transposase [Cucumis melo var. makuwa]